MRNIVEMRRQLVQCCDVARTKRVDIRCQQWSHRRARRAPRHRELRMSAVKLARLLRGARGGRVHLSEQCIHDICRQAQRVPAAHLQRGVHKRANKSFWELQRAGTQAQQVFVRSSFELQSKKRQQSTNQGTRNNTCEETYMNKLGALNMAANAHNDNCSSLQ